MVMLEYNAILEIKNYMERERLDKVEFKGKHVVFYRNREKFEHEKSKIVKEFVENKRINDFI